MYDKLGFSQINFAFWPLNFLFKFQVLAGTFQEQGSSFRRKLSKREKKQLKKQEKFSRVKSIASTDENCGVAEKLYTGEFWNLKYRQ